MIARWMLAAIAFTTLLALAAWAVEQGLRSMRRPTRWPWVIALTVGTVWPLLSQLVLAPRTETFATSGAAVAVSASTIAASPAALDAWAPWLARLEPALLIVWVLLSAILTAQMAMAVRTLRRTHARAQRAQLDGEAVLIDPQLGPAVIGVLRPYIIVPAWLLEMDASLRALVLSHEREHRDAGDPRLVWLAVICTTVMPWNAPLWWIARRLRTAMEIDCDARTLRGNVDRTRYASLLLLIAQRHSAARFVPQLSTTAAQLSRRIAAMRATPVRFAFLRVIVGATVACVAIAAACSPRLITNMTSPEPRAVVDESLQPLGSTAAIVDTSSARHATMLPNHVNEPKYPALARASKTTGRVTAMFIVNADGTVDTATFKVVSVMSSATPPAATSDAFVASVRASLKDFRYQPARVGGRDVRELVRAQFEFKLADAGASSVASAPVATAPMAPRTPNNDAMSAPNVNAATFVQKPYFEFQVEKPATLRAGSVGPKYPQELRDAKVEGKVLAQFVVDTMGVPDLATFKVLVSDHDLFSASVRAALVDMRFEPARVGGRAVKQMMQQPFMFSLSR